MFISWFMSVILVYFSTEQIMGGPSATGGVKPMSIAGRMAREKERLHGMTAEERAWRKKWLADQVLSPKEPRLIPTNTKELMNPFRRFYRAPLDILFFKVLKPVMVRKKKIINTVDVSSRSISWFAFCILLEPRFSPSTSILYGKGSFGVMGCFRRFLLLQIQYKRKYFVYPGWFWCILIRYSILTYYVRESD